MEDYNPRAWYRFTDKDGNTFNAFGDNGYVQQSMTEGLPISVDSNGEWYITPKLTTDGKTITAHIPSWFKSTDEYNQWSTYAPQFVSSSMTQDTYDQLKDALTKLGNQGAMRVSLSKELVNDYGISDQKLNERYFENILNMGVEGGGGEAATLNLSGVFGDTKYESAADFARSIKKMSKEKLSSLMTWLYDTLDKARSGNYTGSQEQLVDALATVKILNYIDDNYKNFGDGEEFKGLLEASLWQKISAGGDSMLQTMAENFPIINLAARAIYGWGQTIQGKPFSMRIEEGREAVMKKASNGGSLEGTDASKQVGNVVGTIGNIAGTMTLSVAMGNVLGATSAASTPGSFVAKMGMFAKTIPGAAVTDFFLNDIPIDLTFFATDWARTGSAAKAFYNSEEEQPLFGIPILGNFGPKAPGGLLMNMVGDAIIDCALPILAIAGNTSFKKLDQWTNGGVTRVREKVAIENLKIQEKITSIPVFGKGWQKFVNYMIGPEHASFMREARKAAIAEGSMTPYVRAQNLLTLANHAGMTDIAPLYKMLDDELEISASIKKFAKETDKWGEIGKTEVKWKEAKAGVERTLSKTIEDSMPKKIKQGLLDIERLSELKGKMEANGGLIVDVNTMKEIAELEKKVSKLPKEIKDFADRFSQLNKGVEMIGVKLGVSNEDWVAALQQNPMWSQYMTRQSLVPGDGAVTPTGGSVDPTNAAILNASRKDYYAGNYIDPQQALWLKTEALGRAYAWNERAKALVSFEVSQGKLVAGKGGVEVAQRLEQIKTELKTKTEFRAEIGYDTAVSNLGRDVDVVSDAFKKIDDLQNLPEKISLKGLYDARKSPNIKRVVDDFETGRIQFADGVKETAGLTDSQAADIIENTYSYKGELNRAEKAKNVPESVADKLIEKEGLQTWNVTDMAGNAEGYAFGSIEAIKNANGEIDAGFDGLTYRQKHKAEKEAKKADALAREEWYAKNDANFNAYQSQHEEWLENMRTYVNERFSKLSKKQQEADPFAMKIYKEYEKKYPEPKRPDLIPYPDSASTDVTKRQIAVMKAPEQLVDSEAPLDYKIVAVSGKKAANEDNFNYLTRGENRRALHKKGYDSLDAKTKAQVDKADNAFTQRTTANAVFYRGEPESTNLLRKPKVGDKLDTSSWTYTQFLPEETTQYRYGGTGRTGAEFVANMSEGVLYRYHVKEGTPVFFKPSYDGAFGGDTEFIFPRGITATVTNVEKGFREPKEWKMVANGANPIPNLKRATIVDVEVDASTAIAPALQTKLMGNAEGGSVEVNVYDNATKAPDTTGLDYNAGMTADGRAFKYQLEDGKITSMEEIKDAEGMAAALSNVDGSFKISARTIEHIGQENAQAIGRTILFYRDNMPDIGLESTFMATRSMSWGFVPWPYQPDYFDSYPSPGKGNPFEFTIEDGKLKMGVCPVYICEPAYSKGREAAALADKRAEVASGEKPRNTATLESTPTHENGHATINKLGILELNRKIDEGSIAKITDVGEGQVALAKTIDDLQEAIIKDALEGMGLPYDTATITEQAKTISNYASRPVRGMTKGPNDHSAYSEVFSEAMRMYQGNGDNSSPFCLAIVEQIKKRAERYTVAAVPGDIMKKNGLDVPTGLMKEGGEYNFPAFKKTKNGSISSKQAKWLDEWRQKNPYLGGKGIMTEEQYTKANLWDTYFQKEIRAYDAASNTAMPELLVKRNGDFLEDLAKNSAKKMVQEIEAASVKGFSQELATMVLSRNSSDISDAMDAFIVQRVNQSAQEIAKKMPGGATEENLNKARATLWSEDIVKNDFYTMVSKLSPDMDAADIKNMINTLFDEQAKGFASIDALPLETKKLIQEKEELRAKLEKENNYAMRVGSEVDKKARSEYVGDVTQVVHYRQAGEDVYTVVKDPVVASMLKRPTDFKSTGVAVESMAQAANFFSRTYRIGTTGANPIAFIRNVLRDPLQATIQGGFNPLNMMISPDVFYHTLRGYGLDDATIDTVTQKLRNWAGESTLTAELRDRGLSRNLSYRNKAEKVTKKINMALEDNTKLVGKIIEKAEAPLEMWESMFRNQIAQQSFIKNYQRTGDVNKAMSSAMFDASNSTTNFSHSVGLFKRATSTVPYLSSAINGTRSFWVQFNVDPIGMVTRLTAGFMVPAMAITAWNLSSEERRKAYLSLPEWYRDSHIVLLDLENNVVAFPIPDELSQYYGTARRYIEYTNDANQQGILSIMTQGAFGFLPVEVDGYFKQDGSIDWDRGSAQLLSGLMPQAVTAIYEFIREEDLFTGQDLSTYDGLNKTINTLSNLFGTGIKTVANDIGMLCGASEKTLIGKSTMDTLARDLFGMGFDDATNQFMSMIGSPTKFVDGKEIKATGLFAESEKLKKEIENLDRQIAVTKGEEKEEKEKEKAEKIQNFTKRVAGLVNNYMNLYTITGGLQEWQKAKIVSILTLGSAFSSAGSESYQYQDMSESYLNERALAQQRYVDAGLPAGPSEESILSGDNSIEIQAALNKLYGAPKQATADFTNALNETGLKDIRNEFYDAIEKIYDTADAQGIDPDYDLIEKIQARYLQSVDRVLVPIINQYGIDILNNNDFIDKVRRYVNGMVPSNDWKQSARNARKYLSKKDFPLATVDVKKWLTQRYSSSMRDRGLDSDAEVSRILKEIKADIDAGRGGAAKGKIQDLFNGVQRSNYYISANDLKLLTQYNNMVK